MRRALREHMGPDDIEQVGLFVQRQFPFAPLAALGHGHLSLAQVRPFLDPVLFAQYLKFAFVRNPFDRYVSYCAFVTRDDGGFERDPRGVMRHFMFNDRPTDHLLFHPQHTFVVDETGSLLTDIVGRVEQMQFSYDEICQRLGVPSTQLERVNASRRGDYRRYYTPELAEEVAAYYRRDLEMFGYDFDGPVA